ncbi:MAG: hypothetical protein ACOC9Y_04720 [Chloroflexota bacterium]
MSGLLDKLKRMISPERSDQAADKIEENVTDERVDNTLDRAPGGERAKEHVPDDVGQKAADKTRELGGAEESPKDRE